jgi:hypothetical protein
LRLSSDLLKTLVSRRRKQRTPYDACQSIQQKRHCLAKDVRSGWPQYGQGATSLSSAFGRPAWVTQIFAQRKEQPVAT